MADLLDTPVFCIPAAIQSSFPLFYKIIDAIGGCLYPHLRLLPVPLGARSNNEISETIRIHLKRYEEDKCAVW